ncbi:hypothetical protein BGZ60DRAFT_416816 [Tricladium varicosporioides]|nr:hypothetical protein BGZ60DRAFT_416816 [Hymenoscyphus varicosporioides]
MTKSNTFVTVRSLIILSIITGLGKTIEMHASRDRGILFPWKSFSCSTSISLQGYYAHIYLKAHTILVILSSSSATVSMYKTIR